MIFSTEGSFWGTLIVNFSYFSVIALYLYKLFNDFNDPKPSTEKHRIRKEFMEKVFVNDIEPILINYYKNALLFFSDNPDFFRSFNTFISDLNKLMISLNKTTNKAKKVSRKKEIKEFIK